MYGTKYYIWYCNSNRYSGTDVLRARAGAVLCSLFSACSTCGFGQSVLTLGYPMRASDFSRKGEYVQNLKMFQLGFQAGTMLGSPFPGLIADISGSYAPAYLVYAVLYSVSACIVLGAYRTLNREVSPYDSACFPARPS